LYAQYLTAATVLPTMYVETALEISPSITIHATLAQYLTAWSAVIIISAKLVYFNITSSDQTVSVVRFMHVAFAQLRETVSVVKQIIVCTIITVLTVSYPNVHFVLRQIIVWYVSKDIIWWAVSAFYALYKVVVNACKIMFVRVVIMEKVYRIITVFSVLLIIVGFVVVIMFVLNAHKDIYS
jgi:hypothetical protein